MTTSRKRLVVLKGIKETLSYFLIIYKVPFRELFHNLIYQNYLRSLTSQGIWGQSDTPQFFWLEIFVPGPITKSFGTTVLCMLRHFFTLIKWRYDWLRYHNKSLTTEMQFFAKRRLFSPKYW